MDLSFHARCIFYSALGGSRTWKSRHSPEAVQKNFILRMDEPCTINGVI